MIKKSKAITGFTLIELLVVVAILGIIGSIGLVSYSGYVTSAKNKSAENVMQQISLGQTEYYSGNGSYFSVSSSSCTPKSSTSTTIETQLLGGADVITQELDFEMCIHSHSSNYMVKAKANKGTCEITMTAHGTFTRTNCS